MPDFEVMGAGVAEGLEKAASNIFEIRKYKTDLALQKEKFNLDKKVKDAQLKKAEFDLEEAQRNAEEDAFIFAQLKREMGGNNLSGGGGYSGARSASVAGQGRSRSVFPYNIGRSGGKFTMTPKKGKELIQDKIIAGAPLSPGEQKFYDENMKKKDSSSLNKPTKETLEEISTMVSTGEVKTQAEALDVIERNREALELENVDIDYLTTQITNTLPQEYDPATMPERVASFVTKGIAGQTAPRKKKYGRWYEKHKDGKWHLVEE